MRPQELAALASPPTLWLPPRGRVVFVAHPVSGDVPGNLARARRWRRWVIDECRMVPVMDWILHCEQYDDGDPQQRTDGLEQNRSLIRRCQEVWLVGGRISQGMAAEAGYANTSCVPVRDLTWLGSEPPASMQIVRSA